MSHVNTRALLPGGDVKHIENQKKNMGPASAGRTLEQGKAEEEAWTTDNRSPGPNPGGLEEL